MSEPPLPSNAPSYRENTPDALFGAMLAMEALLAILVRDHIHANGPASSSILRRNVESTLKTGQITTKYGTGATSIADGARECLESVLCKAEDALGADAGTQSVNAP